MASIFGHTALVIGSKKLFLDSHFGSKVLLLGIVSAVMPDIDVMSQSFGVTMDVALDFLAHRGLTHSLLFALAWSVLLTKLFHKKDEEYLWLKGLFYFICAASHGLLDAMTNGGDGISFFIPFDMGRYFLPYRFIEVSPIGVGSFLSEWGVKVLISEFKYIGIPSILLYLIGVFLNKKVYNR